MDAARKMQLVQWWCIVPTTWILVCVVIVKVRFSAKCIQAVNLVKHINASYVRIRAESESRRPFSGALDVLLKGDHVFL